MEIENKGLPGGRFTEELIGTLLVADLFFANTRFDLIQIVIELIFIGVVFFVVYKKKILRSELLLLLLLCISMLSFFYLDPAAVLLNSKLFLMSILILIYSRHATIIPSAFKIVFVLNFVFVFWQLFTGIYPFPFLAKGAAWDDIFESRPLGFFINTHASAGFAAAYLIYLTHKKKWFGLDIVLQYSFSSVFTFIGFLLQKLSYFKIGRSRILIFTTLFIIPLLVIRWSDELLDLSSSADIRAYSVAQMFDNIGHILSFDNFRMLPRQYLQYLDLLDTKGENTNEMELVSVLVKGGVLLGFSLFIAIFSRLRYFALFFIFTIFHYGYITSSPLVLFMILFFDRKIINDIAGSDTKSKDANLAMV